MDLYPKDDLDACFENVVEESEVEKIYFGSHIFITGATGFLGKILLEKILRTCDPAQVYILVREKKGKTHTERLQDLLNDTLFEKMLLGNREAKQKITLMEGDCTLPDLGLSEHNLRILQHDVDFVFHCAATVNMGEHLRSAFYINVNATKFLLEQAKSMTKLKTFVYVSTAYSQVMLDDIGEKFYKTELSAKELEQLVTSLDDSQLSAITPVLVGKMVNTYSLTKAITEYMVSQYHPHVPVAVARPSIVISTALEPIVGWIDNLYGATGVCAGATAGLLRVWRTDPYAISDLIPVDIAINTILAIGWHVAVHRPKPKNHVIFNLVSSVKKPLTWGIYMDMCEQTGHDEEIASMLSVGCYNFRLIRNETLFWLYTMFLHVIPGLLLDSLMCLARMKPKFLSAYRKVYKANTTMAPYCVKEFKYVDDNVDRVWTLMNTKDKELFNFDMNTYTYKQLIRYCMRGIRVYLFKDPFDTLLEARKRYYIMQNLFVLSRVIMCLFGGWLLLKYLEIIFM